ncbi:ER degradation-enhancing alpha-mannosidase-like protein 2 [Fragariocoptes setiger]|uniref:alpha-1,2-Mannosidase n=1 Tax=Fragariocoptes setiger TaxID=1670756 RepID=A0ABQ7SBD6_9ACAR|nr:ER degradation-enhancing alpha-mannosidase-like protein 2 [Fragariocoptes setiger]
MVLILLQSPDRTWSLAITPMTQQERTLVREKIVKMFYHGYESYLNYAFPFYDELKPLSCSGANTWGGYQLTLIDTLDTLVVIGNYTEFNRISQYLLDNLNFDVNTNVSVFETNIRVVGGLLAAHLLAHKTGFKYQNEDYNYDPDGWPCSGPLLDKAVDVARRLLPAFETESGMPYGTVNLRHGVPNNEIPVSCTAGVGTFIVEFGALSRLTGDPIFENKAIFALRSLHKARSRINLPGNHINIQDSVWTALDSGVGGSIDSFYEYLIKGAAMFRSSELLNIFHVYLDSLKKHTMKNDWWVWVSMNSGSITMPIFQSLEAFWPGLLTLIGKTKQAQRSVYNYYHILRRYGFLPEFYDIPSGKPVEGREGYPLRPEYAESLFYLYRATKDPQLLHIASTLIEAIEHSSRTECGYGTVKNIEDHTIEDRMESFFLAETLKYLYLLFAEDIDHPVWNDGSHGTIFKNPHTGDACIADAGGYVFNTEAHLIDAGLLDCCQRPKSSKTIQKLHDNAQVNQQIEPSFEVETSQEVMDSDITESGEGSKESESVDLMQLRCSTQAKKDMRLSLSGHAGATKESASVRTTRTMSTSPPRHKLHQQLQEHQQQLQQQQEIKNDQQQDNNNNNKQPLSASTTAITASASPATTAIQAARQSGLTTATTSVLQPQPQQQQEPTQQQLHNVATALGYLNMLAAQENTISELRQLLERREQQIRTLQSQLDLYKRMFSFQSTLNHSSSSPTPPPTTGSTSASTLSQAQQSASSSSSSIAVLSTGGGGGGTGVGAGPINVKVGPNTTPVPGATQNVCQNQFTHSLSLNQSPMVTSNQLMSSSTPPLMHQQHHQHAHVTSTPLSSLQRSTPMSHGSTSRSSSSLLRQTPLSPVSGGSAVASPLMMGQQHQQQQPQPPPNLSMSSTLAATAAAAASGGTGTHGPVTTRLNSMQIKYKFGYLGSGRSQFNSPHGFCLGFNQEIIVADTNNHRICIFDKNGTFMSQFGVSGKEEGQLWNPRKVAILPRSQLAKAASSSSQVGSANISGGGTNDGLLFVVCDRGAERSRMQLFTKDGIFIKKIGIQYIDIVAGLAITQDGLIIVVDSVSPTVYIISGDTGVLKGWFDCSNHMKEPSDIAVKSDSTRGNEYFICDFKGHCVVVFSESGEYLRKIGYDGLTSYPNGIDISDDGDILVGDSHGNRFHVVVFDKRGNFMSQFECPHVKVSRCCGLKITREGYIVTLAKNNHHVLILNTLFIGSS